MSIKNILTRNFILCFFSQLSFTAVFHILIPTLPIHLSTSGSEEIEIGVLIGALAVSSLVLRPFVGKALLRTSEKKFMITGALLFVFSSAAYLFVSPFWPFLMIRILQGIGFAFFYTSAVTLVANISPISHRGQSLSYFFLSFNLSFALFPALGMFIINRFNFTVLFLVCLALSLGCLWVTSRLSVPPVPPSDVSVEEKGGFSRKALPPSIMYCLAHIIWGSLGAFFPLYALEQGVKNPGFFFAAYAIVLILSRALGGQILDKYPRDTILLPCLMAYIVSMTILSYSRSLPLFIFVAVIWALGNAFLIPSLLAFTIDLVGSSRGPAMGMYTAFGDLGTGMGPIIMGIILRYANYPIMFRCLALIAVLNLTYFHFFVRQREKNRKATHPSEEV